MFGKRDERKPIAKIDALIGAGTVIEGSIRFSGGLRIDGEVRGNVEAAEGACASTANSGASWTAIPAEAGQ